MAGDPPQKPGNRTVMGLAPVPPHALALPPAPVPPPPPPPPPIPAPPAGAAPAPLAIGVDAPPSSVSAGRVIGISGAGELSPRNIPGTMVGVVSPVARASASPIGSSGSSGNAMRTMMGVARPGIAPTHPTTPQGPPPSLRAAPPFIAPPPPPVIVDAPIQQPAPRGSSPMHTMPMTEPSHGDRITLPGSRPRKSALLPVFVIAGLAAALAIALLAFLIRAKPTPAVTAEVRSDGDARELVVKCATCSDGGTLVRGDVTAKFSGGKAKLALNEEDVALGTNRIPVTLTDGKQTWPMMLEVSIPFLVHADLARLATGAEAIDLVFALAPEVTGIELDGKVTKPQNGAATIAIPVPVATSDDDKTFARTIAFGVKIGGETRAGALNVSIPYASLKLGLPGRNGVLLSPSGGLVEVSGKTTPNAKVRLGADPQRLATADASGTFSGLAKPDADDATSVVLQAFGEGLAPRKLTVTFTRAVSLTTALKDLRAKAVTSFAEVAKKPETHVGEWVDVKLVVAQTGDEDGRTIAVGDVKCAVVEGGPRCPGVRVLLPASSVLAKPANGDVIEVVGVVVRSFPIEKGKSTGTEIDAAVATNSK